MNDKLNASLKRIEKFVKYFTGLKGKTVDLSINVYEINLFVADRICVRTNVDYLSICDYNSLIQVTEVSMLEGKRDIWLDVNKQ